MIDGTDVKLTEAGVALVNSGGTLPAISLTVTDSDNATASTSATPGITTTNDAPTITNTLTNTFEEDNGTVVGDIVATFNASDEDNILTIDSFTISDSINYDITFEDGVVTVTITQAGLDLVNSGQDLPSFTVTVTDGVLSAEASASPEVVVFDDLPSTRADSAVAFENSSTTHSSADGVLSNDFDEEGSLTVIGFASIASTTFHPVTGEMTEHTAGPQTWDGFGSADASQSITTQFGTMTINADGSFTYAVDQEFCEQFSGECVIYDQFSYQVMDSGGNITTQTILIEVRGVNDAVVVDNDELEILEDAQDAGGNVLANDQDIDQDINSNPLKVVGIAVGELAEGEIPEGGISSEIQGQYGTLIVSENGEYSYVPFPEIADQLLEGEQLIDIFTYAVNDGFETVTGQLKITINGLGQNLPPEIVVEDSSTDESIFTEEDTTDDVEENTEETESEAESTSEETESTDDAAPTDEGAPETEDPAETEEAADDDVEVTDDGTVVVDDGSLQTGEIEENEDGSVSVSIVDDNASEVEEYELVGSDESIPDWVTIDSETGEITANPPEGVTEITLTVQTVDSDGNRRSITMTINFVNMTVAKQFIGDSDIFEESVSDSESTTDNAAADNSGTSSNSDIDLSSNQNNSDTAGMELGDTQTTSDGSYIIDLNDQNAGNVQSYEVTTSDGSPLPSWVTFDPQTGQIIANPPPGVEGIELKITAFDSDGGTRDIEASVDFSKTSSINSGEEEEDGDPFTFNFETKDFLPFSEQIELEDLDEEAEDTEFV